MCAQRTIEQISPHQKAMRAWALSRMKVCRGCGNKFLSTQRFPHTCWRCLRKAATVTSNESNTLLQRLRSASIYMPLLDLRGEAADEIDRLAARVAKLEAARKRDREVVDEALQFIGEDWPRLADRLREQLSRPADETKGG